MEEILIRECATNDFDSVFELLKQLWPDTLLDYDALQMVYKNALESDKQKFIVALIDNRIIGFCSLLSWILHSTEKKHICFTKIQGMKTEPICFQKKYE